jgi:hypothetical protein
MFCRILAVFAITALAAVGADNSVGTWKLDVAKSKYTPAPMPLKSYTMLRESAAGGEKVTVTGARADGTPINASYTTKLDGSDSQVSGSGTPYDVMAVKKVDANTYTAEGKNSKNKYHVTFRSVISKDGKTMTTTGKGMDANGVPVALTLVFEKQ